MKLQITSLVLVVAAAAAAGIGSCLLMTKTPMTHRARAEFVFIRGRGDNCDEDWTRHVTVTRIQNYFRRARARLEADREGRHAEMPLLTIDVLPSDSSRVPNVRTCRIEIAGSPSDDILARLGVIMETLRTVVEEENQANLCRIAYNEFQEKFSCERTAAELIRRAAEGVDLSEDIVRVQTRIAELDARIEHLRRSFCEKREDRITDVHIDDIPSTCIWTALSSSALAILVLFALAIFSRKKDTHHEDKTSLGGAVRRASRRCI